MWYNKFRIIRNEHILLRMIEANLNDKKTTSDWYRGFQRVN